MKQIIRKENPIINSDFPDPDIIRVRDTYYMVTTTMHFMPGCDILQSYDLVNWEFVCHVYNVLENTPQQCLENNNNAYGQGMWAPSLRFYNETFYISFTANDTKKTYLYTADNIHGPWKKQYIQGFYHDNSILFDDDERVYIVYGNSTIYLTELEKDLSGPKKNGLHRIIAEDEKNVHLGYEGSHLYKYNGLYYLFCCHILAYGSERRSQMCFVSDSLTGKFIGKCIIDDDCGYFNMGIAQGGIVDTPDGEWYSFMFQDRGAIGRSPYLFPIEFKDNYPVVSNGGKIPKYIDISSTKPNYKYTPLNGDDNFLYTPDKSGSVNLKSFWQFNHSPVPNLWSVTEKSGVFRIKSGKICTNIMQAYNTLTQRTVGPKCSVEVSLDGKNIKDNDFAGLSAFQGCYGAIGLTREDGKYYLSMFGKVALDHSFKGEPDYVSSAEEFQRIPWKSSSAKFKVTIDYTNKLDIAEFFYYEDNKWKKLGITHKLYFKMDHFTGCRFALYYFSKRNTGGYVDFMNFKYIY